MIEMQFDEHVAGVELGGTKATAVIARGRVIVDRITIPTSTPEFTLSALNAQLLKWTRSEKISALGVASFGPIQLQPDQADYGCVQATPKMGWSGANVLGALSQDLDVPAAVDTDVNGAALAEWLWEGKHLDTIAYITVGTGVGVGIVHGGKTIRGALHPEMGHIRFRRAPGDVYTGACSYHADCLEGLISGPALLKRFGRQLDPFADSEAWALVAHDLAQLVTALILCIAPQRILIGGGIGLSRPSLFDAVRADVVNNLGGYIGGFDADNASTCICPPHLGAEAGPLGAVTLAYRALDDALPYSPQQARGS